MNAGLAGRRMLPKNGSQSLNDKMNNTASLCYRKILPIFDSSALVSFSISSLNEPFGISSRVLDTIHAI